MFERQAVFDVYEAGELTVVGFSGRRIDRELQLVSIREEIFDLVESNGCRKLAIDLTGIARIPSGLLGIVASLRERGVEVMIYNPSESVRDVFECTNLHRTVQLCEVAV